MNAFSEILYRGPSITKASKALIVLHGRGGTAHDLLDIASHLGDDHFYIAAPQAKKHTWYPYSFMVEEKLNEPFLSSSIHSIKDLIDEIAKTIPLDHIYLMGFSQGACLALEVTTRFSAKYGGIVAFTGGLIGAHLDEKKYHGNFQGTKVFMSNANKDPHIPLTRSEASKEFMEAQGAQVTLKVYERDLHTIDDNEIFLAKKEVMS